MSDETAPRRAILDKETLIPIGVVAGIVLGAIGIHSWMQGQFQDIRDLIAKVDRRVERLEEKANQPIDRWSGTDMALWVAEFRRVNPNLAIPDPKHSEFR